MTLIITFLAVLCATVASIVAWRALSRERARSSARVAALAAAIDGDPLGIGVQPQSSFAPSILASPPEQETEAEPEPVAPSLPAFGGETLRQPTPLWRPLAFIGGAFALVAMLIVGVASGGREGRPAAQAAAEAPAALELMSMRHQRDGDVLMVTGLVRNAARAPASGVTAVIFAFDANGGFLTSARAPLDSTRLAAGEESPFRVVLRDAEGVGRYRVSFRTDDAIVRHVDRRTAQMARN